MILDSLNEFADAVSVAAAAGTALIGSQIDMTVARDLGQGERLYLVITIDTAIITAGAAGTVRFILVSDASAAIATDGTATEHWKSHDYVTDDAALNELNIGDRIIVPFPSGEPEYERFLGILCETTTTTTTAGKINAFLTNNPGRVKTYADATN